jgi:hypothetical protein
MVTSVLIYVRVVCTYKRHHKSPRPLKKNFKLLNDVLLKLIGEKAFYNCAFETIFFRQDPLL